MAILRAKAANVQFTLRPYRVVEENTPICILTYLELRQAERSLLSTTVVLTQRDLADLEAGLEDVVARRRGCLAVTTIDTDLVLAVQRLDSAEDIAVGFWTGEPYGLMTGYRFTAIITEVSRFVTDLRSDEATLASPAHLP